MTMPRSQRKVTRTDVARYAGVSTAVVSYVVNAGPRPVAAETAARVLKAVRHLIHDHDRRSVGLVIGPEGFATPDPRELGWDSALRERELPRGRIAVDDWTNAGGYRATKVLLNGSHRPDSIFVSSDAQAVGVLHALHEAGIAVARDCPVVSFDGTQSSGWTWPCLTSARQPVESMAQKALELVHAPSTPPTHPQFDVDLIIRASCGCQPDAV